MMFACYIGLTFLCMLLLAALSRGRGRPVWLAVLLFGWTVSQLNTLIEAVAFGVLPAKNAAIQLAVAVIAFAILSAMALTLTGRWRSVAHPREPIGLTFPRTAVIVLGYEALYWGAGSLVWPYVAHFYQPIGLPPAAWVAALQVPRALIFVAAAIPWLRTKPRAAPWGLAIAFSLIGGVAPMFPDNPFMPADVRFAHGIEVGVSNFLFGLLMGYVLNGGLASRRTLAEENAVGA